MTVHPAVFRILRHGIPDSAAVDGIPRVDVILVVVMGRDRLIGTRSRAANQDGRAASVRTQGGGQPTIARAWSDSLGGRLPL